MNLGENILKLRKHQGLSQEQLGEQVNVTRQTISNWELGETTPNAEQLKLLSKALLVSLDELLDNEEKHILIDEQLDNEKHNVLEDKESNTEKLAGLIIKILKGMGLLFIISVVIGIIGIAIFIHIREEKNKIFSTSVELNCSLDTSKYTIGISEDNFFSCDNCNNEMIDILGDLTNNDSMDISVQKIKDYFFNHGGACE